jgi:hypothetical protein
MPCTPYSKKCTGQPWDKPGNDNEECLAMTMWGMFGHPKNTLTPP